MRMGAKGMDATIQCSTIELTCSAFGRAQQTYITKTTLCATQQYVYCTFYFNFSLSPTFGWQRRAHAGAYRHRCTPSARTGRAMTLGLRTRPRPR